MLFLVCITLLAGRGAEETGLEDLKVTCYSGYTYAERPMSFQWQGVEYQVEEIEKEWLEPGRRCFQARTRDSKFFQLCYNETTKEWSLAARGGG
ncbi:MAG: hypothetical protein HY665_06090 [Chloroflexi bacterium]|nr:hypothetical protein [Chloroflexota bacterium]